MAQHFHCGLEVIVESLLFLFVAVTKLLELVHTGDEEKTVMQKLSTVSPQSGLLCELNHLNKLS